MLCPSCLSSSITGARRATDDFRDYALVRCSDCTFLFDAYREWGNRVEPVPRQLKFNLAA